MMSSSRITRSSSPSTFTVVPEYLPNSTLSPTLTSTGLTLPSSFFLPGPTASTSPWSGFSAAVSGITMPEAVLRSSSRRLTMTRSCNGRSFMDSLLSVLVLPAFGPQPGNRASAGVLADSWHSPAATANNRGKRAVFQAPGVVGADNKVAAQLQKQQE